VDKLKALTDFQVGEWKFPETKIGEVVVKAENLLAKSAEALQQKVAAVPPGSETSATVQNVAEKVIELAEKHWPKAKEGAKPGTRPTRIPVPPPIRVRPGKR
jgi:hypothetical protein